MVGDGLFDGFMVRSLSAVDSRNSHASNRSLLVEISIRQLALMTHAIVEIVIEGWKVFVIDLNFPIALTWVGEEKLIFLLKKESFGRKEVFEWKLNLMTLSVIELKSLEPIHFGDKTAAWIHKKSRSNSDENSSGSVNKRPDV